MPARGPGGDAAPVIAKSIPSRKGTRTFSTGIRYIEKHEHKREPQLVGSGVSFSDRVSYASAEEKAAWVHLRGVTSVATAPVEMEALAAVSRRCSDPVHHEVIAYAKHERPTREQIVADAERLLTALDMADHQYVFSVHTDTDDLHAHVIANRVGPDGKANAKWQDRPTRERICAEIAAERGWAIVVGRHNRDIVRDALGLDELPPEPPRRVYDRDLERTHGTGEIPWQDAARPYVLDAVERATSWDDLRDRLCAHGVVLKAVERGGRFQGLAFAESMEPDAPGCGASRISARCKLSALEERFGPYGGPERARSAEVAPARSATAEVWHERMRPVILDAVDRARSWDELRALLADPLWQIDLKAIERGGRVSGLAFARENIADAPGCAASRIDARCRLSALEARFGPYPEEFRRDAPPAILPAREWSHEQAARAAETGTEGVSEGLRARVEREAIQGAFSGSEALERARGIAENARLREEYGRYRDAFFEQQRERREEAWSEERERRREASERRWEAKQFQRAVVRTLTPPGGVRRFGYEVVEQLHQRRTERENAQARERWEALKDELSRERTEAQVVTPLRYRDYVAERAQLGDDGARRVTKYLDGQVRNGRAPSSERDRHIDRNRNDYRNYSEREDRTPEAEHDRQARPAETRSMDERTVELPTYTLDKVRETLRYGLEIEGGLASSHLTFMPEFLAWSERCETLELKLKQLERAGVTHLTMPGDFGGALCDQLRIAEIAVERTTLPGEDGDGGRERARNAAETPAVQRTAAQPEREGYERLRAILQEQDRALAAYLTTINDERRLLGKVSEPLLLETQRAQAWRTLERAVKRDAELTPVESEQLRRAQAQQHSLNPFARYAGKHMERDIIAMHDSREKIAWENAREQFTKLVVPEIVKHVDTVDAVRERWHAKRSELGERENAVTEQRREVSKARGQLDVMERAGVAGRAVEQTIAFGEDRDVRAGIGQAQTSLACEVSVGKLREHLERVARDTEKRFTEEERKGALTMMTSLKGLDSDAQLCVQRNLHALTREPKPVMEQARELHQEQARELQRERQRAQMRERERGLSLEIGFGR